MLTPVNKQLTLLVGVKTGGSGGIGGIGEQGPQGPIGATGPQGAIGPTGATGSQGIAGSNGTNGTNGSNGTNGATGAQGPIGSSGPAGETTRTSTATVTLGVGNKTFPYTATASNIGWSIGTRLRAFIEAGRYMEGVVTSVSPSSVTLLSDFFIGSGNGSEWNITIAGDRGANGTSGTNGTDGLTGPTGPAGPTGSTGPAGATGSQGIQGETGSTGPIGPDGPVGSVDPSELAAKQNISEKGIPNGYASLNSSGKVPTSQLPASTENIIEYSNISLFPGTGQIGTIYIALDTDTSYIWDDETSTYTPQTTVGSLPSNVGFKIPCRLVATTNINIAIGGFPTIDGKLVANSYRILLTAQTVPAENGIYIAGSGAWSRASDANVIAEIRGSVVTVWQGSAYGSSIWFTNFKQGNTLDTTPMSWFQITHQNNIVAILDAVLGSTLWRSVAADGKTILSGTLAPTTEGVNGDFYIRTSTSMLYGPKAAGSWPVGVSLIGATGSTGETGATGSQGIQGVTGAAGTNGTSYPAITIDTKTTDYTLVNGDLIGNKIILMNVPSGTAHITVPTGLIGTEPVTIYWMGTVQPEVIASGATLKSASGFLKIRIIEGGILITPMGGNVYRIVGDLAA